MDPCRGPLVAAPSLGTSVGLIERVRNSWANTTTATCGYAAWFPAYNGAGYTTPLAPQNMFWFEPASSATVPTNTAVAPLGMVAVGTTGLWFQDPAYGALNGGAFSRSRCNAACLQLEYIGATSLAAGQVAIVGSMTIESLITNTGTDIVFPSVDQIFAYAARRERIDPAGHEVKWAPTDLEAKGRGLSQTQQGTQQSTVADAIFWTGTVGSLSSRLVAADVNVAQGIIIAWRGFPATAGVVAVNAIKVIELDLSPSGYAIEEPHGAPPADGGATITETLNPLWRLMPQWQHGSVYQSVANAAASVGAEGLKILSRAYMPGVAAKIGRSFVRPAYAMLRDGEL